jgi:hypothetical protein
MFADGTTPRLLAGNRLVLNNDKAVSAAPDFWSILWYAVIHPEGEDR